MNRLLQVPQFNAFMFLENKTQIGKIDEIFGSIKDVVSPGQASCQRVMAGGSLLLMLMFAVSDRLCNSSKHDKA